MGAVDRTAVRRKRAMLLGFAVVLLVAAFCTQGCGKKAGESVPLGRIAANKEALSTYLGLDLRDLGRPEHVAFDRLFEQATNLELDWDVTNASPWWLAEYESEGTRWILFEGYEGLDVPDVSYARVHCFDEDWVYVGSSEFLTGYRMRLINAGIVREPVLGLDVIAVRTVSTGPFVGGTNRPAFEKAREQRQVYVIHKNRVALVRLEDGEGEVIPNNYRTRQPFKGPPVPERTADEWRGLLDSTEPCEILEALVWLTGVHRPSGEPRYPNVNQESVGDAKLYEEVRDSAAVRKRLKLLARSENAWIREYAELAIAQDEH